MRDAEGFACFADGGCSGPSNTSATWLHTGAWAGARLPLNQVAFSIGLTAGYDAIDIRRSGAFANRNDNTLTYTGAFTNFDVHVLCDWAAVLSGDLIGTPHDGIDRFYIRGFSAAFGVAFQPSRSCRRERATRFGLR